MSVSVFLHPSWRVCGSRAPVTRGRGGRAAGEGAAAKRGGAGVGAAATIGRGRTAVDARALKKGGVGVDAPTRRQRARGGPALSLS